jgi:hypothetical protein
MTLSRREFLVAGGCLTAATSVAVPGLAAMPSDARQAALTEDDYFLSAANPIANIDQRELERTAMRLLDRPEVVQARKTAAFLWRQVMEYPAGPQWSRFESMMDEYTFNYALKAANSDSNYPRVLRIMQPAAHWFGRDVPGSRWGGDSPDYTYRILPIAHGARYEVSGRRTGQTPLTVAYILVANTATSVTLGALESRDVVTDETGRFVITLDSRAAEGRANHIQTQPGAYFLFIRDAIGDWLTETPNALRVRRLDPADSPPLTDEQMAQRAAKHMVDDVYLVYWFSRLGYGQPPNVMRAPRASGSLGGLVFQWGSQGNIRLADDEALIMTANAAGAAFRNIVLQDVFFLTIDYWKRQTSLNHSQMAADTDGRFTYVVAHRDPGVHNWLDTTGLNELLAVHRWQSLPRDMDAGSQPTLACRTVKFDQLDKMLPAGVRRVSAAERQAQIARRTAGFDRRFIER